AYCQRASYNCESRVTKETAGTDRQMSSNWNWGQQEEREEIQEMASAAEALLFASAEPLTLGDLRKILAIRPATLERVLEHLGRTLADGKRGLRLQRHSDQVRLVTAPEMALYIEKMRGQQATQRLSEAALE